VIKNLIIVKKIQMLLGISVVIIILMVDSHGIEHIGMYIWNKIASLLIYKRSFKVDEKLTM